RTMSGASSTRGRPGAKPSSRPPQTRRTAGGIRPRADATSITARAASSPRSWSSSWAVKFTAHDDTRGNYLGGVGEVFVLRELAQCLGLDLPHALARQSELLADRLERGGAVTDEAEAELDHVALAVRQVRHRLAHGQVAERRGRLLLG